MNRILKITVTCLLITVLAGCATTMFITEGRKEMLNGSSTPLWPVYSRTNVDLWLIYFPIWAFSPANDGKGDKAYATTLAILFGPFMIFFGALDLPISITVDTLTLPWDIHANSQYFNEKKSKTSIIDPLTEEEINSLNNLFKKSDKKFLILTEAEASALLSKLRGPEKDDFNNSPEKIIYLYSDNTGFYFYRHSNKLERYIWLHFGNNGKFSDMTCGIGGIPPWHEHIDSNIK